MKNPFSNAFHLFRGFSSLQSDQLMGLNQKYKFQFPEKETKKNKKKNTVKQTTLKRIIG